MTHKICGTSLAIPHPKFSEEHPLIIVPSGFTAICNDYSKCLDYDFCIGSFIPENLPGLTRIPIKISFLPFFTLILFFVVASSLMTGTPLHPFGTAYTLSNVPYTPKATTI